MAFIGRDQLASDPSEALLWHHLGDSGPRQRPKQEKAASNQCQPEGTFGGGHGVASAGAPYVIDSEALRRADRTPVALDVGLALLPVLLASFIGCKHPTPGILTHIQGKQ